MSSRWLWERAKQAPIFLIALQLCMEINDMQVQLSMQMSPGSCLHVQHVLSEHVCIQSNNSINHNYSEDQSAVVSNIHGPSLATPQARNSIIPIVPMGKGSMQRC